MEVGAVDTDAAMRECTSARACFERLGARVDLRSFESPESGRVCGLSPRELEVLRLVSTGQSNWEIAGVLVLSEKTFARPPSNIFTKLGVSSRSAAMAFAFSNRLVSPRSASVGRLPTDASTRMRMPPDAPSWMPSYVLGVINPRSTPCRNS